MRYINYFPGDQRDSREVIIADVAEFGKDDIIGLVDSMIMGWTSSAPVEGAKAALEDGSIWGDLCSKHDDEAVQDALEELHALLAMLAKHTLSQMALSDAARCTRARRNRRMK